MDTDQTKPLAGRNCLVTGSTRGIGFAIAKMLVLEGARVCISGRSQATVSQAITQLREVAVDKVEGKAADVRLSEHVDELFRFIDSRFGGLDVLVNNAGVGIFRPVSELLVEEWKTTIETNLYGVFYCTR